MRSALPRLWWAIALRGGLAILFGLLTFFWPGAFWLAVVLTFAAYALVDGVLALVAAFGGRGAGRPWPALLLQAFVGIAAGIAALVWPGLTEVVLLYLIAGWAVATGVFGLVAAIRLRREIEGEWALGLSGVMSIVFGLLLVFWPVAGLMAVAWVVGVYALIYGVVLIALAVTLRRWRQQVPPTGAAANRGPVEAGRL